MPDLLLFLRAFDLQEGRECAGYILQSAEGTRKTMRMGTEYHYKITLVFTNPGTGTYLQLLQELQVDRPQLRQLHGKYHTYTGILDPFVYSNIMQSGDGMVVFNLCGRVYRN